MSSNNLTEDIKNYIGHKAFFLIGARRFVLLKNGLQFDIRGSERVNRITVVLEEGGETYTVKFWWHRTVDTRQVSSYTDIRPVEINILITQETGIPTSVNPI